MANIQREIERLKEQQKAIAAKIEALKNEEEGKKNQVVYVTHEDGLYKLYFITNAERDIVKWMGPGHHEVVGTTKNLRRCVYTTNDRSDLADRAESMIEALKNVINDMREDE